MGNPTSNSHSHLALCLACGKFTPATDAACSKCGHVFTEKEKEARRRESEAIDDIAKRKRRDEPEGE